MPALAKAKAKGEDPWPIVALQQRYLDRWSIVMARANAHAVDDSLPRRAYRDYWPPLPLSIINGRPGETVANRDL